MNCEDDLLIFGFVNHVLILFFSNLIFISFSESYIQNHCQCIYCFSTQFSAYRGLTLLTELRRWSV